MEQNKSHPFDAASLGVIAEAGTPSPNAVIPEFFRPADFLTNALKEAGHPNPDAWAESLHPGAHTEEKVEHRIFHVNRALRLYMSEQKDRDNTMQARQLLSDGIDEDTWRAIVNRGVVPWLMNTLPVKKNAVANAVREVTQQGAWSGNGGSTPLTPHEPEPVAERDSSMDALESIQE